MKVSIDIDEDLLRRARRLTGLNTKREVVQRALDPYLYTEAQIRKLRRADPDLSPRQVLRFGAKGRK